ncbi:hypothetical membrane protein [Pseudomonas veronii 1YdBTEX2]|uniref:Hypothetical membrane protein n=1 Tax=Pseudomonas veronii 1YdBTEX2 TaxID=1295141 RepID=A0A1D3K7Y8_PSEVE|nr:hypothetical membrane protein [Pseudomonas veronii 1YdBTEX2]
MTNVQAKTLKIWALVLWTALWCWVYAKTHGQPIPYMPGEVEINALLFCVTGWFLPWLPKGLMLIVQAKHKRPSK